MAYNFILEKSYQAAISVLLEAVERGGEFLEGEEAQINKTIKRLKKGYWGKYDRDKENYDHLAGRLESHLKFVKKCSLEAPTLASMAADPFSIQLDKLNRYNQFSKRLDAVRYPLEAMAFSACGELENVSYLNFLHNCVEEPLTGAALTEIIETQSEILVLVETINNIDDVNTFTGRLRKLKKELNQSKEKFVESTKENKNPIFIAFNVAVLENVKKTIITVDTILQSKHILDAKSMHNELKRVRLDSDSDSDSEVKVEEKRGQNTSIAMSSPAAQAVSSNTLSRKQPINSNGSFSLFVNPSPISEVQPKTTQKPPAENNSSAQNAISPIPNQKSRLATPAFSFNTQVTNSQADLNRSDKVNSIVETPSQLTSNLSGVNSNVPQESIPPIQNQRSNLATPTFSFNAQVARHGVGSSSNDGGALTLETSAQLTSKAPILDCAVSHNLTSQINDKGLSAVLEQINFDSDSEEDRQSPHV